MIKAILRIRFNQLMRILDEIGAIYILLLLLVLFPLLMGVLDKLTNLPSTVTAVIMIVIVGSIHLSRQDKDFVKLILNQPFKLYITEYVLIILPVAIGLIHSGHWQAAGLMSVGTLSMAFLPVTLKLWKRQSPLLRFSATFTRHYEWLNGLRKSAYLIIPIYIVSLALSGFTAVIPIVLFVLGLITTDFYMDCEPRIFLELYGNNARSFLRKKIYHHLIIFWIACLPLVLLFFIFHYSYWYILLVLILVISVLPILSITLKYATYQPNIRLTQNGFVIGLMVAFLTIPFTQPVPLVMAVFYYKKAVRNLEEFMN